MRVLVACEYGTFTEKYDKELFTKNGYTLERR